MAAHCAPRSAWSWPGLFISSCAHRQRHGPSNTTVWLRRWTADTVAHHSTPSPLLLLPLFDRPRGAASFAPICFDPRLSEQPRLIYIIRFRSHLIQFRGASLQFNCWFLENGTSCNLFFVGRISSRFTFKIWYKWIPNLACSSNSSRSEENSTILRFRIPFKSLSLSLCSPLFHDG